MKLHGSLISPFTRMCMVTALECSLGMRVQLKAAEAKLDVINQDLQRLSPIAKIPVLETDHGHALYDSRVIMEYLCHVAGNKGLLPDEGSKHFRILTLQALAQGLGDAAVALRYETAGKPEAFRWPDFAERLRARVNASLDDLEANWREDMKTVTLGSIATAVVLSYIDFRHDALQWRKDRPTLAAFHQQFCARESMANTALKAQ